MPNEQVPRAKTSVTSAIIQSVETWDGPRAWKIVNYLWARHGLDHGDCAALFHRLTGIETAEFDALLYQGDWEFGG